MRLMILFLTMIIGTLTACACGGDDRTSDGNRTNSGSVNGGAGGDTGFHSTGGSPVGDESGTAGKGGTGPIGKGPGWLYRLDHWKDIHIEGESKFDVLSEANVKSLNLPSAQWDQECGPSCERFKFNRDYEALVAYTLIGSARGKNGPEAFVFSREYPRESQLRLWRVQSLTDGKLNGLLRLKPVTNANKGSYFGKGASPNFVLVHTEEGRGLSPAPRFPGTPNCGMMAAERCTDGKAEVRKRARSILLQA